MFSGSVLQVSSVLSITALLFGSGALWILCASVIGVFGEDRFPREFALIFTVIGCVRVIQGIALQFGGDFVYESLMVSLVVGVVAPIALLLYLFHIYPPREPPEKPRELP